MKDSSTTSPFVEETKFGNWFLNTETWRINVLIRALKDLKRLLPANTMPLNPKIVDVGCGFGHSFKALNDFFSPKLIVGLDADPGIFDRAGDKAKNCDCEVQLKESNAAKLDIANNTFDVVFCHQTFHHIVEQEAAMAEFFRILKPGGLLLFAESTKRYIHSIPIRLLFRHPMDVQKTADEYIAIIRESGFTLNQESISFPYLWWSRPDLGFYEWIGLPVPEKREETLVNLIATKG